MPDQKEDLFAHLPPSQQRSVAPDDLGYSASERAVLDAHEKGQVTLCHRCNHALVVTQDNVRGQRAICTLFRGELRDIKACSKFVKADAP